MVAWNSTNSFGTPVNGTSYSVGNTISGGGTVIYNGSGTSYSHSPLSAETTYYYRAWSVSGTTQYSTGVNATATTPALATVTIGSGSATANIYPITSASAYSYTQQIYTQAQINQAGTIEKLRFYKSSANAPANSNYWSILLGHTTKTSFTSTTDWIPYFSMSLVYEGTVSIPSTADWMEITLQTPFEYNNTQNLVVAIDENLSGTGTATSWYTFSSGSNTGINVTSTSNINPTAPPTAGSRNADRNQIQIKFSYFSMPSVYCIAPQNSNNQCEDLTLTNIGSNNMTVSQITDNAGWLTCSATLPQTIIPGGTMSLSGAINTTGLSATAPYTTYTATITVTSTIGVLLIPVSLKVIAYTPPTHPRHIAQYEPARGAIIRYPFGIPNSMIDDLIDDEEVLYVVTSSQAAALDVLNDFLSSAQLAKIQYIIDDTDSYWIRDWGPISIFEDDGAGGRRLAMIDFDYNRDNRPNDEAMIPTIANYLGVPYYFIPLSLTGGNILTDGMHREFADDWVVFQNDGDALTGDDGGSTTFTEKYAYTPNEFYELVSLYRGDLLVKGFEAFPDPQTTYIHHMDCWAKLLWVDRVLIADGMGGTTEAALDAIAAYWGTLTASNNQLFQVFRVNCPNNEPYTNSYILNDEIFMPYWGTGGGAGSTPSANDTAAISAYYSALSGLSRDYTVTGYFRRSEGTAWLSTDAIHCRVHTIFALDEEPPLPVELSTFTVTLSATNQAMLTWVTQTETGVAGFYIHRGSTAELADAEQLNTFIEATNTSQQQSYVYVDEEIWQSGTYYYWLESRDMDGSNRFYGPISITIDLIGQQTPPLELVTGIDGIYPNPFNPVTTIAYTLKNQCQAQILIYNIKGQLVRKLLNETKSPGNYRLEWDSRDNNGTPCASGLYSVVLRAGNKSYHRKAVLLK